MDFLKKLQEDKQEYGQERPDDKSTDLLSKFGSFAGQKNEQDGHQQQQASGSSSLLDKLHGVVGGGPESEKKEDALDKGIDWVQENIFKQGAQSNEDAAEQAKDKLIANTIREQYKKQTGNNFPAQEKKDSEGSLASKFGF
ncbi:hypothetical protein B0T25DRAFT_544289 [Lasiosphaeria hispida]|uniref:Uncharacterized protein n=1 Tax=Lasiosphaeria hispida TaxID=260671 RepID=A0AAJ0MEM8_9PEZI|nr:hypothetical protein B0T25DRAFT_544289 [Lasiosphaeria hispida]